MAKRNIIVIGASAGGIAALSRLLSLLPADLDAAIFIAQHLSPTAPSILPDLLDRSSRLPAAVAREGEAIRLGRIYVAAPDRHLLLRPGLILSRRGPQENRTRPAINALFRSAALAYGAQVVGVVLTGLLDDGTDGLIMIKAAGGTSVVQDPDEAEWPSMPRNALQRDHVDHCLRLDDLAERLVRLAGEEAGPVVPLPPEYELEDRIAAQELPIMEPRVETPGAASRLSCPDCGGVLNEVGPQESLHFRCQVGHAFTPLGLAQAQTDEIERALAVAARTHRDRVRLFGEMHDKALAAGRTLAARRWAAGVAEAENFIRVLEEAMSRLRQAVVTEEGADAG